MTHAIIIQCYIGILLIVLGCSNDHDVIFEDSYFDSSPMESSAQKISEETLVSSVGSSDNSAPSLGNTSSILEVSSNGVSESTIEISSSVLFSSDALSSMAESSSQLNSSALNGPIAEWTFDDSGNILAASVGPDLLLTETVESVEGPNEMNQAVRITAGNYLSALHGISPNNGSNVNEYTLVMDVQIPEKGTYYSLFQTDVDNTTDGDLFLDKSGKIGIGVIGYSLNTVYALKWYRVVISVKNGLWFRCYVDGELFLDTSSDIDGRMSLKNSVHFAADENGEDNTIDIAELSMYNYALSHDEVLSLGAYSQASVKKISTDTPENFKILVATDLHCDLQNDFDEETFIKLESIIDHYQPDFLVINGDLTTNKGVAPTKWVVDRIAALGVPWVFARGNHDDPVDYTELHEYMKNADNSYHGGTMDHPNYRIEVHSTVENKTVWNIFVMDNGYTWGIQQSHIQWFNSEVARIGEYYPPAFAFFHVPLPQYLDAWNLNGVGEKNEDVYSENGILEGFNVLAESGMIKGMWCGHDHINTYNATLNNVRLEYTRSSGMGGYAEPEWKRGATLITVNTQENIFTSKAVFHDDL